MHSNEMKGGVFALGNFDGAHRGHRFVIDSAVAKARSLKIPVRVLTFEPHPRTLFLPKAPPFRLTPAGVKERILKSWGIDDVIVLPFTSEFAQMSASDFVENVLCTELGVQHIFAGHDFTFGHNRAGDMAKLAAWLASHRVEVTEMAPLRDANGLPFSATRIRDFLRQGDVAAATNLLGRAWSVSGIVIKGAERGKMIGVPTANITLGEYLRPKFGVYAITAVRVGDTQTYRGVANIGVRPTVDGVHENFEAHLFDFDQDIYGQEWQFTLMRFIRPEQKFGSLDALKAQIAKDIVQAQS